MINQVFNVDFFYKTLLDRPFYEYQRAILEKMCGCFFFMFRTLISNSKVVI